MSRKLVDGKFIAAPYEGDETLDEWKAAGGGLGSGYKTSPREEGELGEEPKFCNEVCRNAFAEGNFSVHGGCDTCPLADEPE